MTKLRLLKPTVSNAHFHGCYLGSLYSAEKLRKFAEKAVEAEREACAVIAETPIIGEQDDITMEAKNRVAKAIRARGQA